MKKMSTALTQNINESLHAHTWRKITKNKYNYSKRIHLCAKAIILEHNCGHDASSIFHLFGALSYVNRKCLKKKDTETIRRLNKEQKDKEKNKGVSKGKGKGKGKSSKTAKVPGYNPGMNE